MRMKSIFQSLPLLPILFPPKEVTEITSVKKKLRLKERFRNRIDDFLHPKYL